AWPPTQYPSPPTARTPANRDSACRSPPLDTGRTLAQCGRDGRQAAVTPVAPVRRPRRDNRTDMDSPLTGSLDFELALVLLAATIVAVRSEERRVGEEGGP